MATKFDTFSALHNTSEPFLLPNAWNAASAVAVQECSYRAVGTSSAAVATTLGYPDGEVMPFSEYLVIIKRIGASVSIPLTVDLEMGYGRTPDAVYQNIQKLLEADVIGINIEDSVIKNGKRFLNDAKQFAELLSQIKNKLNAGGQSLFINVRCDTYLLDIDGKENETTLRLKLYESAGADGIFLPFIKGEQDIAHAVSVTKLPLNVMALHDLPDLDKLNQLGVKRVSMGPFLHNETYSTIKSLAKQVLEKRSIKPLFKS